jgi:adenylate cyclase
MGERRVAGRRLAAILAADVAGYSRLIRADEEGTIARLRTLRRELIDPAIDGHAGRIIKTTGDGLLIEFASVVDAVRCAVSVQRGMVSRNEGVPEDRRIIFRVGINLGDVVVEGDGDLMGDGVNIASRLEGLAEPGGICISDDAYRQVRDKLTLPFADLGDQSVKNIDRPVRMYCLCAEGIASLPDERFPGAVARAEKRVWWYQRRAAVGLIGVIVVAVVAWGVAQNSRLSTKPTVPALSIVVLPFTNLSGDPKQEYFAEGVTENITTDLSRIRGSFVIAHSTADTFKGKENDVRQIARELGVRYVLEGSVQRDGDTVRVNAQLIDGTGGQHLWAERFDADRANLLDLQSQVTGRIATSLRLELISVAAQDAARLRTKSVDGQDYVLQARAMRTRPISRANFQAQQQLFQRGLALDSTLDDGWSGLAISLAAEAFNFPDADQTDKLQRAEIAAAKALAINERNAEAHDARGWIRLQQKRLDEGATEEEIAASLDENDLSAYGVLGLIEAYRGNVDTCIAAYKKAIRLSPRDPFLSGFQGGLAFAYVLKGNPRTAISWGVKARDSNPQNPWAHVNLAAAYALDGEDAAAHAALADGLRLNPHFSIRTIQSFFPSSPLSEPYYEGLRKAGMPEE